MSKLDGIKRGDQIWSHAHKGGIVVTSVRANGIIGRKVLQGGGLHGQECVVADGDIVSIHPQLPGFFPSLP